MNNQGTKAQSRTEPTEVDGVKLCSLSFLMFMKFLGVLVSWLFISRNFFMWIYVVLSGFR